MAKLALPQSIFLTDFMFWVILKCGLKVLYDIGFQNTLNQSGPIGDLAARGSDFFLGIIGVWAFGAIWSKIWLISYGTIITYFFILIAILSRDLAQLKRIKIVLWVLFSLSIFSIWIEPHITFSGRLEDILLTPIAGVSSLIHVAVFLVRFLLTINIIKEINSEIKYEGDEILKNEFSDSKSLIQPKKQRKNPIIALFASSISLGVGGYFYLGQIQKGIALILLVILLFRSLHFFYPIYFLSMIDTYRLALKYNRCQAVKGWEVCVNWYTITSILVLFFITSVNLS